MIRTIIPSRPMLYTIRNHMNHGGGMGIQLEATTGPRAPLALGLDASEASQHILRLLESSYHAYQDSLDFVWHEKAKEWIVDEEWKAVAPRFQSPTLKTRTTPQLLSLQFADPRTAFAHVKGISGEHTMLSLLRLTSQIGHADNSAFYNGWRILRSVRQQDVKSSDGTSPFAEIEKCIHQYYAIEHGGGTSDAETAKLLFHPSASLLTVGIAPVDQPATSWTAPSGSLLEIPLAVYLEGVATQTPHQSESSGKDQILSIRVTPCRSVAAVALCVGNGNCDTIFHDHLLLGKQPNGHWNILSKVFSVQNWS